MPDKYLFVYESASEHKLLSEVREILGSNFKVETCPLKEVQGRMVKPDAIVCAIESKEALDQAELINHRWPDSRFILVNVRETKVPLEVASNGYDHVLYGEKQSLLPRKVARLLTEKNPQRNRKKQTRNRSLEAVLKAMLLAGYDGRKIINDSFNTLIWELLPKNAAGYWADDQGFLHLIGKKGKSSFSECIDAPLVESIIDAWAMATVTLEHELCSNLDSILGSSSYNLILKFEEEGCLLGLMALELASDQLQNIVLDELELSSKCIAYALQNTRVMQSYKQNETNITQLLDLNDLGLISLSDSGDILNAFGVVAQNFLLKGKSIPSHVKNTKGAIRSCLYELLEGDVEIKKLYSKTGVLYRLSGQKTESFRTTILIFPESQSVIAQPVIQALRRISKKVNPQKRISEILNEWESKHASNPGPKVTMSMNADAFIAPEIDGSLFLEVVDLISKMIVQRTRTKEIFVKTATSQNTNTFTLNLWAEAEDVILEVISTSEVPQKLLALCLQLEDQGVSFSFQEANFGLMVKISGKVS